MIGLEVRLTRLVGDDVRCDEGKLTLAPPLVEDAMPRLDVVVAHGDRIVAEVVHRRGDDVRREGVDVVVVVRRGFTLQEVTSVQQQGLGVGTTDLTQYRRET